MKINSVTEGGIAEMPIAPKPGEILLYLSLNEITNMTAWNALKLAENLGFKPQLRYRAWQEENIQKVGIYALLHYELRDYDSALESEYLEQELEALWTQIQPSIAVNFAYRLKPGRSIASTSPDPVKS